MMGKLLFVMLAAGAAGLGGWAIAEPFAPKSFPHPDWWRWEIYFVLSIGACIGLAIGGVNGLAQGSRAHILRGAFGGLALGAVAGFVGYKIGGGLAHAVFGDQVWNSSGIEASQIVARTLVFVPIGGMIGLVQGIAARSWPRAVQGLIGGVIGGGIGGAMFDITGEAFGGLILAAREQIVGEVGAIPRAIASVSMGAAIGLFVGIVELLSRRAWLRLELGRNEGKEWIVDAARTFIGRSENAHVPLFGDPNVMPMHACIVRSGGSYRLLDGGSPMGIGINGIRAPEALLSHGDVINIGTFSLRFLLRNPRAVAPSRQDAAPAAPSAAIGLDPGVTASAVAPAAGSTPWPASAGTSALPAFALVAVDGPMAGRRFAIGPDELVAGREASGIALSFDASASRRHASFTASPSGALVRDLGSTNGTVVNGVRVQEMALRPGDTVKIGSTTFRLE